MTAAQLRKATAEAERASAAKAEFVASMSHELRTPLNAVIGYSQMLLEDAVDEKDEAAIADLEKIHSAGQNLLRRVNEVLDLSKIEAGKMELATETVVVEEFLDGVADQHRGRAAAKGLALSFHAVGRLGAAEWDGGRVRQLLDHILDNAVKFTEAGAITISAERRPGAAADEIMIRVRDTGVGIPADILPSLFEMFTGAEDASASKYGDTGLGLALSQALCRIMGGQIAGESIVGRGSCFTVILPVAYAPPASLTSDGADAELSAA
jgi:signal transduction histidine kinase